MHESCAGIYEWEKITFLILCINPQRSWIERRKRENKRTRCGSACMKGRINFSNLNRYETVEFIQMHFNFIARDAQLEPECGARAVLIWIQIPKIQKSTTQSTDYTCNNNMTMNAVLAAYTMSLAVAWAPESMKILMHWRYISILTPLNIWSSFGRKHVFSTWDISL